MPGWNKFKYSFLLEEKIPYFHDFMDRYSKSTYMQNRNRLIEFILFLENKYKKDILDANVEEILDFFKNIIDVKKAPKTGKIIKRVSKNKWRTVLNSYYKYVKEIKEKLEKKAFINPVPSINLFDFSEREITIEELEKEEDVLSDYSIVERILNYLYFTRSRLFVIVCLLLYSGGRIIEICSIKLANIDLNERFFYVKIKSKKALNRWGIYFFPKFFTPFLKGWIDDLRLEKPDAEYLFQHIYTHISTKTPRKHLRNLKNELGLTCKINPHAFRDFINTERFDRDLNVKYRSLLLNQTPGNVNVMSYVKKYKKRKELQRVYDATLPFPPFKPKLSLI